MIKLNTKELQKVLKLASEFYKEFKKFEPSVPLASLTVRDNTAIITATNLDYHFIRATFNAQVNEPVSIALDKNIISIINSLTTKETTIEIKDNNTALINDVFNVELRNYGDTPSIDFTLPPDYVTIADLDFSNPLLSVDKEDRLNYLYIHTIDNQLRIVGTDGHRLTVKYYNTNNQANIDAVIPLKHLKLIEKLFKNSLVNIAQDKNYLYIFYDKLEIQIKKLGYTFPNYQSVIPTDRDKFMILDRKELLETLKQIKKRKEAISEHVALYLENHLLKLKYKGLNLEIEKTFRVQSNADFEVGFKIDYLIDALSSFNSKLVYVYFTESDRQVLFTSTEDPSIEVIVAPYSLE